MRWSKFTGQDHWFAFLKLVSSNKDGYIYKIDQDDVSLVSQENIVEKIINHIILTKQSFQDVEFNINGLTIYKHCMLLWTFCLGCLTIIQLLLLLMDWRRFSLVCKDFEIYLLPQLLSMYPSSTPWKHHKTLKFSDVFRRLIWGALGKNVLILI